ncbi:hypothetical protein [Actinophytocola xanthii]|uniref:Pyridine nucleotide-disulfide oxidoreductase n=1 Tax=Actinophytocola xanthii TaxID=1912961 RepID=A0A1Q8CSC4_9PSEU|nr:hypothetical protein [Actinophytocola xanthii]OLF17227.1 hypothetical protein BU204_12605 [Actinophytocola xanthii]
MAAIDRADVRRLLESEDDTVLVYVRGEARVVPAGSEDDELRGALHLTSRREVLDQLGGRVPNSDAELDRVAAGLSTALGQLGG